jgi:hypothetical protein
MYLVGEFSSLSFVGEFSEPLRFDTNSNKLANHSYLCSDLIEAICIEICTSLPVPPHRL